MLLKHFKNISLIIILMGLMGWKNPAHSPFYQESPCEVYGNIFYTEFAKDAHYVVYVQTEEAFADLVIYNETEFSYADRPGHWFTVETPVLADRRIYITENISEADFTIAYTDTESFAGCDQ